MQKAYSRINWQNEPSTETALGANNLNKVDKALDIIDDRVLALYGYQYRVAQSEKNAKTSEINAKTSETNAKQSELKAKEYAEHAFSGTPEGYAELVDTVGKMDIQTTTDTTLLNSKAGGYKLLSMRGNSVQNGTPTSNAPQSIHNVGDCVEIGLGVYAVSDGTFSNATTWIINKNPIPCASGDVIAFNTENTFSIGYLLFYKDSQYVSYINITDSLSATVPSGVTHFIFEFYIGSNYTLDTVGKISLTINDKYVVQIVENGKNLLDCRGLVATTTNGITFTPSYNSTGELEYINVNGTASADTWYNTPNSTYLPNGNYVVTTNSPYSLSTHMGYVVNGSNATIGAEWKENGSFTLSEDTMVKFVIYVKNGVTVSNARYYTMIRKADITDDTYEPYKEKVATVLLNEPLREDDVMSRTEVVRKRHVLDLGTLTWTVANKNRKESNKLTEHIAKSVALTDVHNLLCSAYTVDTYSNVYNGVNNNRISIHPSGQYIEISDSAYTDATEFKNAMSGVMLEYELATPTTETLDTDSHIALNSLETFNGVTYINVDSRVQPSEIKGEYGTSMVGARTIKNELRNDTLEIKYNELAVALVATESGV